MAIEEPSFKVLKDAKDYQIRQYDQILVAQTLVDDSFEESGNRAFKILADFIFGNNSTKEKVAMTAPVNMHREDHGYMVQFTMPKAFDINNLPIPNNKSVEIRLVPARTVAVYTYSGSWSKERFQAKLKDFIEALKRDGHVFKGEPKPSLARYNSPFQLWFLRRNEIWIEIES